MNLSAPRTNATPSQTTSMSNVIGGAASMALERTAETTAPPPSNTDKNQCAAASPTAPLDELTDLYDAISGTTGNESESSHHQAFPSISWPAAANQKLALWDQEQESGVTPAGAMETEKDDFFDYPRPAAKARFYPRSSSLPSVLRSPNRLRRSLGISSNLAGQQNYDWGANRSMLRGFKTFACDMTITRRLRHHLLPPINPKEVVADKLLRIQRLRAHHRAKSLRQELQRSKERLLA